MSQRKPTPEELSPIARLEALTQAKQARMLRLTLERIKLKKAQGLALSLAEGELLAECYRRLNAKPKETIKLDSEGRVIVTRSQDVEPIIKAMKDYADIIGPRRNDKVAGAKLVGGIDPITATNWSKETGLKIGTKEFAQFAKKRISDDIDFRRFRVGH